MSYEVTGRRRPTKIKKQQRFQKRKREDVDVEKLEASVNELDPATTFTKFSDLPLSEPTKVGLKACHYINLTDIQSKAIALALRGSDILGAAKTGSGKTLAFIIPVLENLYRAQCIGMDAGLGAMIISPTRELAIQIFDVLYKIGKHGHLFAAGLIIGGKSLQEEQDALARMNIAVCTPGRMLQHLSQTASFHVDSLKMLILDEADRIMDMGFQKDVDAIIEYLPKDRQTLLFSATQTKRVSDLARLSLRNPEYVSVHEAAASATPKTLQQNYVLTPLPEKLDTLWSFLKSSTQSKIIVFLSSGKQVRFVYESFRRLQPGIPLLHLHGRQKQAARLEITTRFAAARYSCLFSTDVAARGLDFPAVDWVVQVDCPEDADTYIHRVGRTARYERDGHAVLFLDPSEEEGMLTRLAAKKVPIERINVRAKKQQSITQQMQGMCFKDPELKYLGQKSFASYVRSLHVQKDKEIFDINQYKLEEFAASLGLPGAPRIKFLKGDAEAAKARKNAPRRGIESDESEEEQQDGEGEANGHTEKSAAEKKPVVRTKYDRMFERRNQDILADHYSRMIDQGDNENQEPGNGQDALTSRVGEASGDDEADDLFTVKQRIAARPDESIGTRSKDLNESITKKQPFASEEKQELIIDSNRRAKALLSRAKTAKLLASNAVLKPSHVVFDEETGEARDAAPVFDDETAVGKDTREREEARAKFLEEQKGWITGVDIKDRQVAKDKRREKKIGKKEKEKERMREEAEAEAEGEDREDVDGNDEDNGLEVVQRPFEELADLFPAEDEDEPQSKPEKKKKKWFQDGSDDEDSNERPKKRSKAQPQEAETLEDLEALARGVLG